MKLWANTLWQSVQRLQPHGQPQLATEPLNLGTIVSGRFQITAVLGEGGFGRTYRATHLNRFGQDVALKEFAPDRRYVKDLVKAQELFEREAQVLFKLDHPQIPKFLENVIDRQGGSDRFFITPFFIANAIDRWQDRPRLETPETPEETSSPENVQTVSECDQFNAEYVERQMDQSHPYLMLDIDDAFYEKYPELEGQPLDPGDPKMEDWCTIGNEFLAESQD